MPHANLNLPLCHECSSRAMDSFQTERIVLWTINNMKFQSLYKVKDLDNFDEDAGPHVLAEKPPQNVRLRHSRYCKRNEVGNGPRRTRTNPDPASFLGLDLTDPTCFASRDQPGPGPVSTHLPGSPERGNSDDDSLFSSLPSIRKKFYVREYERKRAYLTLRRSQKVTETIERSKLGHSAGFGQK